MSYTGTPIPTGPPTTWEEALRRVQADCFNVMVQRHRKYGPNNINGTGLLGIAVRLRDKWERFWRAVSKLDQGVYDDESLDDTMIDMANYPMIAMMYRFGWWDLPMEEPEPGQYVCPVRAEDLEATKEPQPCCRHLEGICCKEDDSGDS